MSKIMLCIQCKRIIIGVILQMLNISRSNTSWHKITCGMLAKGWWQGGLEPRGSEDLLAIPNMENNVW